MSSRPIPAVRFAAMMHRLDRATDPAEARNLAEQHPAIVARLAARFESARTENPDFPLRAGKPAKVKK